MSYKGDWRRQAQISKVENELKWELWQKNTSEERKKVINNIFAQQSRIQKLLADSVVTGEKDKEECFRKILNGDYPYSFALHDNGGYFFPWTTIANVDGYAVVKSQSEEQTLKWVNGISEHIENFNTYVVADNGDIVDVCIGTQCCPDFSCCNPEMLWDFATRKRFYEATIRHDEPLINSMLMEALGTVVSGVKSEEAVVHLAGSVRGTVH